MTDLQTLEDLLKRADIHYTLEKIEPQINLSVERGYSGFVTNFEFSPEGKLLDMGAYE